MSNDPVQVIKNEEAASRGTIEQRAADNTKKIQEYRLKKEKNLEDHKQDLRKKGQADLETAKQEAMKKYKEIAEAEERKKQSLIQQAESRQTEAVKKITAVFEQYIVN
ncbi:hypothetical protein JW911_04260 [Candidatus Peregrinibacteria bacterium]|nr:hypothetical protein [Candidatus Peregrinibacteria bacterium]